MIKIPPHGEFVIKTDLQLESDFKKNIFQPQRNSILTVVRNSIWHIAGRVGKSKTIRLEKRLKRMDRESNHIFDGP